MRSRRAAKRRRYTTMPANATPTSIRKPNSLRSALTRARLLLPGSGPGLAVLVARGCQGAQAALQVVEDEAHRRLRLRHCGHGVLAVEHEEDAAFGRRRLELHERTGIRIARRADRLGEQRSGG